MMEIYASRSNAGEYVNKVGKYLKQTLDGAYKIKFSPMECQVFMEMLFEVPEDKKSYGEIKFEISIVSYQNKLRINITELTEREKTVGQIILKELDLENLSDLHQIKIMVVDKINKFLEKEYPGYYLVY